MIRAFRRWRRAVAMRRLLIERDRRRFVRWHRRMMDAYVDAPTYGEARLILEDIMARRWR